MTILREEMKIARTHLKGGTTTIRINGQLHAVA
jgi:hypothetical protein